MTGAAGIAVTLGHTVAGYPATVTAARWWGLAAGLTGLAGYLPYLRDAWQRTSGPDPAAWLIWTAEYSVLLAAQAAQHPPPAALCLAALQLAGTAAVSAVLATRGGWHFTAGRWALLGCAAAVMTAWRFTHAPALAICLALAVEGAGMILAILNAYRRPGSETLLSWWAFAVAGLADLPALGTHAAPVLYAYPACFTVMGAAIIVAAHAAHPGRHRPPCRPPGLAAIPPARPDTWVSPARPPDQRRACQVPPSRPGHKSHDTQEVRTWDHPHPRAARQGRVQIRTGIRAR
jgi:hypothetical protein